MKLQEATGEEFYNRIKKLPLYSGNSKITKQLILRLAQCDPESVLTSAGDVKRVGNYTEGLLRFYNKNDAFVVKNLESTAGKTTIKSVLAKFARCKKALVDFGLSANLQDYATFDGVKRGADLCFATDQKVLQDSSAARALLALTQDDNIITWAQNEDWVLQSPLSFDGSVFLGRGTSWCTARKGNPHYYLSYKRGGLFVFKNKKTGKLYQYCNRRYASSDNFSFCDQNNAEISSVQKWVEKNNVPQQWLDNIQSAKFSLTHQDGEWYLKILNLKKLKKEVEEVSASYEADPTIKRLNDSMQIIINSDWHLLRKKLASDKAFTSYAKSLTVLDFFGIRISLWDFLIDFPGSGYYTSVPLSGGLEEYLIGALIRILFEGSALSKISWLGSILKKSEVFVYALPFYKELGDTIKLMFYKGDMSSVAKEIWASKAKWVTVGDMVNWFSVPKFDTLQELISSGGALSDILAQIKAITEGALAGATGEIRQKLEEIQGLARQFYFKSCSLVPEVEDSQILSFCNATLSWFKEVLVPYQRTRPPRDKISFLRFPKALKNWGIVSSLTDSAPLLEMPLVLLGLGHSMDGLCLDDYSPYSVGLPFLPTYIFCSGGAKDFFNTLDLFHYTLAGAYTKIFSLDEILMKNAASGALREDMVDILVQGLGLPKDGGKRLLFNDAFSCGDFFPSGELSGSKFIIDPGFRLDAFFNIVTKLIYLLWYLGGARGCFKQGIALERNKPSMDTETYLSERNRVAQNLDDCIGGVIGFLSKRAPSDFWEFLDLEKGSRRIPPLEIIAMLLNFSDSVHVCPDKLRELITEESTRLQNRGFPATKKVIAELQSFVPSAQSYVNVRSVEKVPYIANLKKKYDQMKPAMIKEAVELLYPEIAAKTSGMFSSLQKLDSIMRNELARR